MMRSICAALLLVALAIACAALPGSRAPAADDEVKQPAAATTGPGASLATETAPVDTNLGQQIADRLSCSTVYITLAEKVGNGWQRKWIGSGELIDKAKGLVLTNHHVSGDVGPNDVSFVQFPQYIRNKDGTRSPITVRARYDEKLSRYFRGAAEPDIYRCKLIKTHHLRDLSLIQLDHPPPMDALPVRLASASPTPGARVHSMGNRGSSGAAFVYTLGYVRQVSRKRDFLGFETDMVMIETNSPIGGGDSGGPMFNDRGELVGVCSQGSSQNRGILTEVSWYVDLSEVRAFLKEIEPSTTLSDQERAPRLDSKNPAAVPDPATYYDRGEKVYRRVLQSAVTIVYKKKYDDDVAELVLGSLEFATGSIIDAKNRYILTSYSVASKANEAYVLYPSYDDKGRLLVNRQAAVKQLRESKPILAKVVARDAKRGLTLLQADKVDAKTVPLRLAETGAEQGERIHCLGSSSLLSPGLWGYTPGCVRQLSRTRQVVEADPRYELDAMTVQTTSQINGGDMGAPVVNDRGELVALTLEFNPSRDAGRGFNLFVDVSEVHAFLKDKKIDLADQADAPLLEGGTVPRGLYNNVVRSVAVVSYGTRQATGVLIDARQGLLLTNYNVGDRKSCAVQFPIVENGKLVRERKVYDQRRASEAIAAELIDRDASRGIALFRLAKVPKDTPAIPFAPKRLQKGSTAHAIGNPAVAESLFSYLPGTVREVYHRKLPVLDMEKKQQAYDLDSVIIEADLPLNRGDSGGPIFNEAGELAGVNFGMLLQFLVPIGNGYARRQEGLTIDAAGEGVRLVSVSADIAEIRGFLKERNVVIEGAAGNSPDLPPKKGPPPKKDEPKKDEPKASSEEEEKADKALAFAKGIPNETRQLERLEDLVKKYPNTKAAREAKELIKKLKER